jgi:hypothetical protein
MPELARKCRTVCDTEKFGPGCLRGCVQTGFVFLIANNMQVNYSLHKVGVYKMVVSMVSVVRCAGKIWNGEREIYALPALLNHYHDSTIWWE